MGEVSRTAAAFVASQLREFLRAPTLHRPAWIHGERALPDGQIVFKLALGRFAAAGFEDPPPADKDLLVEAARVFVREVCLWERATHYQLLCLPPEASADAVRENYRAMMSLLHPDRQEPGEGEWPASAAQRVNEAHDVLSNEGRRREYDQGTRRPRASFEAIDQSLAHAPGRQTGGMRVLRNVAMVSAIVAALFVIQAWLSMDQPPQHVALLERTFPAGAGKPASDASPELPRFLEPKAGPSFDSLPLLEPPRTPRRLVTWVPPVSEPRASTARSPLAAVAAPARPPSSADALNDRIATPTEKAPVRAEAATSLANSSSTLQLAQAMSPPIPTSPGKVKEIELLVARLVSSYEQGDTEGLMGLFAPGQPGFLKGYRTRSAYEEFFRATRDRRLKLDRLDWQAGEESARVRGDATVTAEYIDGRSLERQVPIEIEISLREGRARMTRLSLFPETN